MDIINLSINSNKHFNKKKEKNGSHSAENNVVKSIQQEIYNLKTEITSIKEENTNLVNIVQTNENYIKKVKELEIACDDLAQYVRKNNVKISSIQRIFKNDVLEDKIAEIFNL